MMFSSKDKENEVYTTPKVAEMLFIGRKIPKALLKAGWRETDSMHIGYGDWAFNLKLTLQDTKSVPTGPNGAK